MNIYLYIYLKIFINKIVNFYFIKMEEKIIKMPIILSVEDKEPLQTEIENLFLYLDLTKFIEEKLNARKPIKQITFEENGSIITIEDDMGTKIFIEKYFNKIEPIPVLNIEFNKEELDPNINFLKQKEIKINKFLKEIKGKLMDMYIKKNNYTENDIRGFKCNSCKKQIIGHLYKCSKCDDNYFLCENCNEINLKNLEHPHPFYIL